MHCGKRGFRVRVCGVTEWDALELCVVTLCSVTHLSCDALDISKGDALIIGADDELEEVVPQDLKHHAHVSPINAADLEVVQQLNCLVTFWIIFVGLSNLWEGSRTVRLTDLWCDDKRLLVVYYTVVMLQRSQPLPTSLLLIIQGLLNIYTPDQKSILKTTHVLYPSTFPVILQ